MKICLVFINTLFLLCFSMAFGADKDYSTGEKQAYSLYQNAWKDTYAGNYKAALQAFKKSSSLFSAKNKWLAMDGQAWLDYYQGELDQAKEKFTEIIKKYPQTAYLSYKGLGFVQLKSKQWNEAYQNLSRALEINSQQSLSDFLFVIGAYVDNQQYALASNILNRAQVIYPYSGELLFYKANIIWHDVQLWSDSNKKSAYPILISAAYYAPVFVSNNLHSFHPIDLIHIKEALVYMGWGLYVSGDYKAALMRFNQYLDIESDNLNALRGKGFALLALGDAKAARSILSDVVNAPGQIKLAPVTTYYYPKNAKPVVVYLDALTMLGWAQYYNADYREAKESFEKVLKKHPDRINARLGLAYVLNSIDQTEAAHKELATINRVAPGYGVLIAKPEVKQLFFTLQATPIWYSGSGRDKNSSQSYQASLSYHPNAYMQLGSYYAYRKYNYKSDVNATSSVGNRLGYYINLYAPLSDMGYLGVVTKGNYFFRSPNDNGARHKLMPYFGLSYKTPDQLNSFEVGYARQRYSDLIKTRVDQYSTTLSSYALTDFLLSATAYYIDVSANQTARMHYFSLAPSVTYFINDWQNIGSYFVLGRRQHAYDMMLNKVYDIADKQQGGIGLTYGIKVHPNILLFVDGSFERYKNSSAQNYNVYYLTLGLSL